MRFTERITITTLACDRCDRRIPDDDGVKEGWLVATVNMMGDPFTVEHHFCPECRTSLGDWLGGDPAPFVTEHVTRSDGPPHFCARCNDGEHGSLEADGVCRCCRTIIDGGAFEAYRAERKRLGL